MSVAGGLENAFVAGARVGCDCLQIFVKNQRQWTAPPLTEDQVERYRQAATETGLAPVVAHASYLLNLASPNAVVRKRSIRAMVDELDRCDLLGVSALIFHPGAHMDDSMHEGIKRAARSLDEVQRRRRGRAVTILLECTAGQGSAIGWQFEQLGDIIARTKEPDRLGVCLDTCHLFAAGYDFRKVDGYAAMIDQLDRAVGVSRVRCIHANDSKRECGSRVDRHEHIGEGCLGEEPFRRLLHDARFAGRPLLIETEKTSRSTKPSSIERDPLDVKNLETLRRLRASGRDSHGSR